MEYVIVALLGVIGLLFYERNKRKSAEAILDNNETLKSKAKTEGLLEAQEAEREKIKSETEARKEKLSDEEITDFYNKLFPDK